ncbi:MAG: amino acid racemase [Pseudomonadota bacterium]
MTPARTLRRVGILGGMGPEATVLLMSRIIARTPARDDQDHIPLIVDNNTQVPSRLRALIDGDGPDPGPALVGMARGLQAAGAQALALPCNTAHYYAPLIQAAVKIPFIDMIESTVAAVSERPTGERRIGILGSPAVQMVGLFDQAFARIGATMLYPDDQDALLAGINAVKSGTDKRLACQALERAAENLTGQGAELLLIACSELSVIADSMGSDPRVVDTIDVLADGVVAFATSEAGGDSASGGSVQPFLQLSA